MVNLRCVGKLFSITININDTKFYLQILSTNDLHCFQRKHYLKRKKLLGMIYGKQTFSFEFNRNL